MRIILGLGTLLALAVGGYAWFANSDEASPLAVRTAVVTRGDLVSSITATGVVEPEDVVDVGTQVAGKISTLGPEPGNSEKHIDYGSRVEEGSILARIDDALFKVQVDQARASLKRAEAELQQAQVKLEQAERNWRRVQKLWQTKTISETECDEAEAAQKGAAVAIKLAEAAVDEAKSALALAEINLGYTTITSPVRGVIIDRRVNIGQTVVASLNAPSLFLIAKDLKRVQVWASVNEADIGQIHPGQKVQFTVDAYPNETFRGEVLQIRLNATMTQNVVTYTVVVVTDNSSGKLLPYLTANLRFELARRQNVLRVPASALRWQPPPQWIAPDVGGGPLAEAQAGAGPEKPSTEREPDLGHRSRLWIRDGQHVRPVSVGTGLSDGAQVEIVEGQVQEGTEIVVGEMPSSATEPATSNPFLPKLFGGRSKSKP
jgi:HlyD family secretion protein